MGVSTHPRHKKHMCTRSQPLIAGGLAPHDVCKGFDRGGPARLPARRIDEVHTLVGAGSVGRGGGGGGGLDISNLIKPALARGEFQVRNKKLVLVRQSPGSAG